MASGQQEYVIAPWGNSDCETELCTITLPSRECIVQLETPVWLIERMRERGQANGISMEQTLAEQLEYNMAQLALLSARSSEDVAETKEQLTDAREYLSGIQALNTDKIETDIESVWAAELTLDE